MILPFNPLRWKKATIQKFTRVFKNHRSRIRIRFKINHHVLGFSSKILDLLKLIKILIMKLKTMRSPIKILIMNFKTMRSPINILIMMFKTMRSLKVLVNRFEVLKLFNLLPMIWRRKMMILRMI